MMKILVVEDERLLADSLQTLAQKKGVSVFYMIHGTDF